MMQIGFLEDVVNNINLRIIADSSGNKTVEVTLDLDIVPYDNDTIAAKIKEFVTGPANSIHIWAAMTICLVERRNNMPY